VNDITTLFPDKYELDSKEYFITKIQSLIPEEISSTLLQFQDKYTNLLVEKSNLDFLSLAE
jgi:hypothetical protein